MARRCASAIFQDYPDDDVIIMNANSTCLKSLQDYDDIIEIDYDNEVGGLGMFDGFWEDAFSRALAEVTAWNIQMIQADKVSTGDHEVTVCIVDSGVSSAHPEFTNENFNGTDTVKFYGNPWPWGSDGVGHGTHVAGIIAASSGNNEGIGSLGGNLKVHITRALDDDGKWLVMDFCKFLRKANLMRLFSFKRERL